MFTRESSSFTCALTVMVSTCAMAGVGPYEIVDLGVLPHPAITSCVPYALNERGEAVGYFQRGSMPYTLYAWVWRPGEGISELPPPEGFARNVARDITNSGLIVGHADHGLAQETSSVGWIWENGAYTLLPPFPKACTGVIPFAINANREVVGRTCLGGAVNTVFYWSENTGYIDLEDHGIFSVGDINDAGVVVGGNFSGAVLWTQKDGIIANLGTLDAPFDDSASGEAINESNEVAGVSVYAQTGPDHWRAIFWSESTGMISIAPTVLGRSIARGLNNLGAAVGGESNADDSADVNSWIWTDETGKVYLANLITGRNDFSGFDRAVDINDAGWILARGDPSAPFEPYHPIILRPIVEQVPGDVDGDGDVDFDDFSALLASWGDPGCGGASPCPADIDNDGDVDFDDFTTLLANWS